MDYFGRVRTTLDNDPTELGKYDIELDVKDCLMKAAPIVYGQKGQTDPYIVINTEKGPALYVKNVGSSGYSQVSDAFLREPNEDDEPYFTRMANEKEYFTLEGFYSNHLNQQLNAIQDIRNAKDIDKILSYISNFMERGIILVSKVCK